MNQTPSFKILVPFISIYTLCLFLPTVEVLATYTVHFLSFTMYISVPSLVFPAIYPMADSMTEIYGKKVTFYIIISSYTTIITFSLINNILLSFSDDPNLYHFLMKPSILLTIMGPIGYFITSYINIKFISKLKMLMRGKHFIIRSFVCSGISDILLSLIVLPAVFYQKDSAYIMSFYAGTVFAKIIITIPFVLIARLLVSFFRFIDGIEDKPYNPSFIFR